MMAKVQGANAKATIGDEQGKLLASSLVKVLANAARPQKQILKAPTSKADLLGECGRWQGAQQVGKLRLDTKT